MGVKYKVKPKASDSPIVSEGLPLEQVLTMHGGKGTVIERQGV